MLAAKHGAGTNSLGMGHFGSQLGGQSHHEGFFTLVEAARISLLRHQNT